MHETECRSERPSERLGASTIVTYKTTLATIQSFGPPDEEIVHISSSINPSQDADEQVFVVHES
jgi:hypothetical protein